MAKKKVKKAVTIDIKPSLYDKFKADKESLVVDSALNELANKPPEEGENYTDTINSCIVKVGQMTSSDDFRAVNIRSHRILGAAINMLKSARDHLGEK